MSNSSEAYWNDKYQSGQTGWNIGYPSTPLKTYFDQLTNKELKILIPGAGNSYEAEYLFHKGFTNVYVLDISVYPLQNFKSRVPDFPKAQLLHSDFFALDDKFDLIIEQTFFCAQQPPLRKAYCQQMHRLLHPGGKVVGLLFQFPLTESGPPFGGNKDEYRQLFQERFDIQIMETAYNSIKPRANNELFMKLLRKEV